MIRRIIRIDQEKCNGCGACAEACHEDAIAMVDGKAQLMRDDYCDGLGDCLPACPTGAITFVEREAAAYDEQAVAQPVAVIVPYELCLAVHHGDGVLVTGGGAGTAAVAFFLIDLDDPSNHFDTPLRFLLTL